MTAAALVPDAIFMPPARPSAIRAAKMADVKDKLRDLMEFVDIE